MCCLVRRLKDGWQIGWPTKWGSLRCRRWTILVLGSPWGSCIGLIFLGCWRGARRRSSIEGTITFPLLGGLLWSTPPSYPSLFFRSPTLRCWRIFCRTFWVWIETFYGIMVLGPRACTIFLMTLFVGWELLVVGVFKRLVDGGALFGQGWLGGFILELGSLLSSCLWEHYGDDV